MTDYRDRHEQLAVFSIGKEKEGKQQSDSKRLRNVLYLLYTQNNKTFGDFDSYYGFHMNEIINSLKLKLNEREREEAKENKQGEVTKETQEGTLGSL